jgi:hypothetical protein
MMAASPPPSGRYRHVTAFEHDGRVLFCELEDSVWRVTVDGLQHGGLTFPGSASDAMPDVRERALAEYQAAVRRGELR